MTRFVDRVDAGRRLAEELGSSLAGEDVVVLGIPRGGVPVAYEIAAALDAPLDVIVVRKLGVPFQPELAMGAVGEGGARVLDREMVAQLRVGADEVRAAELREEQAVEERTARLRRGRGRLDLSGRTAVIVDDGMATGSTARTACLVARQLGARHVVVAVPVAPAATVHELSEADAVVAVRVVDRFVAVGAFYRHYGPVTEDEVIALLDVAERRIAGALPEPGRSGRVEVDVVVPCGDVELPGLLVVPRDARMIVVFAQPSGSGRHGPRNRFIADVLDRGGIGTLLLDLLTPAEERRRGTVLDVGLLADRLTEVTRWLRARSEGAERKIGYFGAGTGAAAALLAAARPDASIAAVVCRAGRPDLAMTRLAFVRSPTLLVVGSADEEVLALNRRAHSVLRCPAELVVVRGATHLFEEPGALAEVALLARDWFADSIAPVNAA